MKESAPVLSSYVHVTKEWPQNYVHSTGPDASDSAHSLHTLTLTICIPHLCWHLSACVDYVSRTLDYTHCQYHDTGAMQCPFVYSARLKCKAM